jgi:hypothetical protein
VVDALDEIFRRSHPHQVARSIVGKQRRRGGEILEKEFLGFADAQPADGITVEADRRDLVNPQSPEIRVNAALDDPEKGLSIAPAAVLAAQSPACGPAERIHRGTS